ncbi:Conjugative transfer protein TrbJ [Brevundimonas diminuta 3F5N]|uniref:Conjugative transfer protein TrbJ n=2 Tax=Brevundimonas diminuta TaxID=293 RepID=A0A1R4EQF2_BREDI|nr:Conjugative transfer protein TrbJ [Brevundimonas diminuta 3F5N]
MVADGVRAQQVVFDPRNHMENALQAARQLESLANEARSLAASPYSHLARNSQTLQDMAELARTARGLAASVEGLEQQFADLYPEDLSGADALRLLEQSRDRSANARRTAEDLARTAAELERLGQGRGRRLSGALEASQAAQGQTAAVQSSNQMLAVLAEDLAALRVIMLAQARLMSEGAARGSAERAAGVEARRRAWARPVAVPNPPAFDPLSNARN